jgi:Ca2+-binding EF-hand superfamily protein
LGAAAAGIRRLDTDRDGQLSRAEHSAGARKMFENMDKNHDGKVTVTEIDAAYRQVKGRRPSRSMKARNLKGADRIKLLDRDGDGAISVEEHTVDALVAFDKMDQDKNGLVTKVELAANHSKVLRKGRPKRR